MANFFPTASRLDTERTSSLNRRVHSRNASREAANDPPSDSRAARPSHINWLQNPAMTQAGPSMPRQPPSIHLGRSASLSALTSPTPTLRRQSSLVSNHSLQLVKSNTSRTGTKPSAAPVKQLSPISERSYVPTPKQEHPMDMEPTTPGSIGSTCSVFLRRQLKRSISATSSSSLRTNATPTHTPVLPPLNISPLEIRPVYPPVSHRVSTVFEDAGSERTDSFITARSDSDDEEDRENDAMVVPNAHAHSRPSNSTFSAITQSGSKSDPDKATDGTTRLGSNTGGSGSGDISSNSNSEFGPVPPARLRPRRRAPTSGGSGSGSEGSIWHQWTRRLSVGSSRISRPSFSAARCAIKSRLPPLPILLFWTGFLAPWCWLIGGWLITEGRWEDNGKARAALPLWKPRPKHTRGASAAGKRPRRLLRRGGARGVGSAGAGVGGGVRGREIVRSDAGGPQLPLDPFAKDMEQGDAAGATALATVTAAQERQAEEERGRMSGPGASGGGLIGGPREWWYWVPCAGGIHFTCLPVHHKSNSNVGSGAGGAAGSVPSLGGPGLPSSDDEKMVTFVKSYSAEVWVYRCRVAAVLSAFILLIALIVALVVIRTTNA